jgi:phosphoribosylformylglycinamidine synthase II
MNWRIEIKHKQDVFDALGESIHKNILDLGLSSVSKVDVVHVYNITGALKEVQVQQISDELLSDHLTQEYQFSSNGSLNSSVEKNKISIVEIAYNPGVMDPVEESTLKGIRDLGISNVESIHTAKKYFLHGNISKKELDLISNKVLSNKIVQHVVTAGIHPPELSTKESKESVEVLSIDLINAKDKELKKLSEEGQLFLNLNEMQTIQKHFKKIKRNPTDAELETIAQTWSEHCYHKTFRCNISYETKKDGKIKTKTIRNLLKSTIVKATYEINKPWCVSVFHDNAGVIKFDKDSHVCFKVETHNHPSALEPFGGANTGIGGVLRDILGTGLGARPICNTNIFCFAPPETKFDDLPAGTLHPKNVMKGVVSGVRDYGNKMGIPTVNGAILFDERFVGNPLVYCGSVGILPKNKVKKAARKGDMVIVAGGRTGRDGIHGATFSSGELTTESEIVSSGAVQIGNPIEEKKVLDAQIKARDLDLYNGLTDCGAGGLSSAVGEMGEEIGVRVDLEKVPLKYDGLNYDEIWISESQERMVFAVNPKDVKAFIKVFEEENVEAVVIGEFTGKKKLELFYNNVQVCDLSMEFLYEGTPNITKKAKWHEPKLKTPKITAKKDYSKDLLNCLAHLNVCSKEWVIRQYDHEVQGSSVIKPLVGVNNDGPSDASVIAPKLGSKKGIAVSNGINVRFGMIDPFHMATSCIDEALRQIVAVGGNVDKIAILDNFCWGNPDKPDRLGGLVRAAEGCYKAAVGYQVPFISGKDSLYNEYAQGNKTIAIPGTVLISAIGIVDDVTKTVTMDLKEEKNLLYIVGKTDDELGGSIYLDTLGQLGANVPQVNFKQGQKIFAALHKAAKKGLVRSMHDLSEGGLGVALAEMSFAGGLGMDVDLRKVPYKGKAKRDDNILFSESNTRFIVEVSTKKQKQFENELSGTSTKVIGLVTNSSDVIIRGLDGKEIVNMDFKKLKESWQKPLRW